MTVKAIVTVTFWAILAVGSIALAESHDLHIAWVGMIDNSEGGMGGDVGNFHYEVYVEGSNKAVIHGILYGPSTKPPYEANYEWGDEHEKSYDAFMIHKWQANQSSISIKIWESDHGEVVPGFGNRDDIVLDAVVRREDTTGEGLLLLGPRTDMTPRPDWLRKLPSGIPHDRKAYFRFVTRTIEPGNTYRWVHVGYGDIPDKDRPRPETRGIPDNDRCDASYLGRGAVCPFDDGRVCHYKTVSSIDVIGGRGQHPGKVYECIGPREPSYKYKWKMRGRGDIGHNDLPPPTKGSRTPAPNRCDADTIGLGAVCPDDENICHYKTVSAATVIHGGGKHPGDVYECVRVDENAQEPKPCTFQWVHRGHGDIRREDLGSPSSGRRPDPGRCNASTLGLGVVCPDDDPTKCHYKKVTATRVIQGGGSHPGPVYECVCQ